MLRLMRETMSAFILGETWECQRTSNFYFNNSSGFICHFHIAQITVMNIFKYLDKQGQACSVELIGRFSFYVVVLL